jgi:hypothetical protein
MDLHTDPRPTTKQLVDNATQIIAEALSIPVVKGYPLLKWGLIYGSTIRWPQEQESKPR